MSQLDPHLKRLANYLVDSQPSSPDLPELRAILGNHTFDSIKEVAECFGISANTCKQSWRSNGMPGSGRKYPLAEIVFWLNEWNNKTNWYQQ